MHDQTLPGNRLSINLDHFSSSDLFHIRQYVQRNLSVLKITICALATFGRTVFYILWDEMQNEFMSRSALNGQRGYFSFGFLKFEKNKKYKNKIKKINYQNRIFASQGIKMKLQRKDCNKKLFEAQRQ